MRRSLALLLLAAVSGCDDGAGAGSCDWAAVDGCDGLDDDCDGLVDEDADFSNWYADRDGDGYGAGEPTSACQQPSGHIANDEDCDDDDGAVHPSASEVCDGVDNDCDELVDDFDSSVEGTTGWYLDYDGDGYGDGPAFLFCEEPSRGYAAVDGDCDDLDADLSPGSEETCDGLDNDCDGLVDDDDPDLATTGTWYRDGDGDGHGDPDAVLVTCGTPAGYVEDADDCDDSDPAVNPSEDEVCLDGIDNDCSGDAPECPPLEGTATRSSAQATVKGVSYSTFGHWMAGADLSGDGVDDLVISDPYAGSGYAGAIYVFSALSAGDAWSWSDARSTVTTDSANSYLGYAMAVPGDLTGDGYADLVSFDGDDTAWIFDGPFPLGETTDAYMSIAGITDAGDDLTTAALVAGGDFDGDGWDDVVLGDPEFSSFESSAGAAWILLGPVSAFDDGTITTVADALVGGETTGDMLGTVVTSGDSDADGIDELVVTSPATSDFGVTGGGAAYVFEGSSTGLFAWASEADARFYGAWREGGFGSAATLAGDVDGDGYVDLAVSAPDDETFGSSTGCVYVFFGPLGSSTASAYRADATTYGRGDGQFGVSIDVVRGFEDDEIDDLLVGELGNGDGGWTEGGAVLLFYGKLSGSRRNPDAMITGTGNGQLYGFRVRGLGDIDADGYGDFAAGAWSDSVVDVFYGGDGM